MDAMMLAVLRCSVVVPARLLAGVGKWRSRIVGLFIASYCCVVPTSYEWKAFQSFKVHRYEISHAPSSISTVARSEAGP
jgi:hypothetical protein